MSYYFKDKKTNKVYSDVVPGANKVNQVYRYKTLLNQERKIGASWTSPTLYIKDGNYPIFVSTNTTSVPIEEGSTTKETILYGYSISYMPIASYTISSISGRYLISEGPDYGSYYIPYDTTPEMYRYEIFKNENNEFKPIVTDVDYSKGGKISWRISEDNLSYFNYTDKGPKDYYYIKCEVTIHHGTETLYFTGYNTSIPSQPPNWSNKKSEALILVGETYAQTTFMDVKQKSQSSLYNFELVPTYQYDGLNNDSRMNLTLNSVKNLDGDSKFFPDKNCYVPFNAGAVGFFIKSLPYSNDTLNKFGFNVSVSYAEDYVPSHFNLSIDEIKNAGFNKLHITMDGLYLFANNTWGNTMFTNTAYQSFFVNNSASFSSDTYRAGTNKYCQALFYAIDNNSKWVQETVTTGVDGDYMNNGRIYSNLTANKNYTKDQSSWVNHKPVASDKDYTFSHTAYNSKFGEEVQKLDNINLWRHFALKYVTDNNKCYTTGSKQEGAAYGKAVTAESAECPNFASHHVQRPVAGTLACYEECPYCNGGRNLIKEDNEWFINCDDNITVDFIKNVGGYVTNIGETAVSWEKRIIGIKAPITAMLGQTPVAGYWVVDEDRFYSTTYGTVCNGNGIGYVLSGYNSSDYWKQHTVAGDGWAAGEWEYIRKPGNRTVYNPKKTSQTAVCPTCGPIRNPRLSKGFGRIQCYCYDNKNRDVIVDYMGGHFPAAAGKLLHKTCDGEGIVYPYTSKMMFYRFKFYGKTQHDIGTKEPNKFEGFAPTNVVTAFSASDALMEGITPTSYHFSGYVQIDDYDADNWDEQAQAKIAADSRVSGCFSYKDTTPDDFVDYREKLLGDSALYKGKTLDESYNNWIDSEQNKNWNYTNWLLYAYSAHRSNPYYYCYSETTTPSSQCIRGYATYDLLWSAGPTDKYGNELKWLETQTDSTAKIIPFNTTGFTPSAGSNFSFDQVKLDYTIDLTNETRDYIHIAFPYVTVFNSPDATAKAGIIPQMIMTYEGTN